MNIPTTHNAAGAGEIAKTVLMPGDPLRAKFIAENYLDNVKCYNTIRNMLGFTGEYKGRKISVQGSGMGMPSIGIYSYELYNYYDVDNIIRIGSAGAIVDDINLRDIIIGQGACTNSNYASQYNLPGTYAPIASYNLLSQAVEIANKKDIPVRVGNILSSDLFYDDADSLADWTKMGVLAVEMEAAALYMNAARAGKNALCILTISDCPLRGLATTPEDREKTFTQMMEIAIEMG
ncbi:MAG: purine-nucleoside phosphorylase [Clostridiales bacterium]|nr:purine-nucleoside phosphorylase [Clostridiales bacterium]